MSADGSESGRAAEPVPEVVTGAVPVPGSAADWPLDDGALTAWTDHYFTKTKAAVGRFGDQSVTYALFLRRPVVSAPRLAISWLEEMAARRGTRFDIDLRYQEGRWVGAGEPLMYVTGFDEL